jgi:hypothetical protein
MFYKRPIEWTRRGEGWFGWDPYDQRATSAEDPGQMVSISYFVVPHQGGYQAQVDEGADYQGIGNFGTVDEAKARCQEHADERVGARLQRA